MVAKRRKTRNSRTNKKHPGALAQPLPDERSPETIKSEQYGGILAVKSEEFSGPLPPPELLKQYDDIVSGFADRIISMAEKEQSHRHQLGQSALSGVVASAKRGQILAFTICSLLLSCSAGLIALDHDIAGAILGGSTLVGLACIFITGRRKKNSNPTSDT